MFEEEFRKNRARRERIDAGNRLCDVQYDSFSAWLDVYGLRWKKKWSATLDLYDTEQWLLMQKKLKSH